MNWPTLEEFEAMVVDALDHLPDDMVDGLDNVVFLVEDTPDPGDPVLGIYEGVALTERSDYGYGELPDRIVIYSQPLIDHCESLEELTREIHVTLVHEIAHYYGIDDDALHQLGWA
jgi:predicted Zn-dependent protease with MMP-like domain